MEKLITELPNANLLVCGYDNTVPQMQQLYQQLFRRCAELPNVTHLGALTKQELATLEMHVDAYLYPTTFEDTFCIMAIEAMAAGLPFIASEVAALPYTCKDSGAILIPNKSNEIDQDAFISKLKEIIDDYDARERIHYAQLEAAKEHTWERVTGDLLMHILNLFDKTNNANRVAIEYLYNSDIQAINHLLYKNYSTHEEIEDLYAFSRGNNEKLQQHYKEYEIGENSPDPIQLKPVDLSNNLRYVTVRNRIVEMQLSEGATILDIGCHYGEYIINLARDFPQYKFIGVDFLTHCIEFACEWAIKEKLNNVEFRIGDLSIPFDFPVTVEDNIDLYIAAEVLEHLPGDSWYKLEQIINNTNPHVAIPHVLITTPWGPWEAKSYKRVYPYRFHLHHFERTDLEEIFGNQEDYNVINVPEPSSGCGSYITTFKYSESFGTINYGRKNYMQAPRETIALCAIVKDAEKDIKRMLASITSYVDEIIIGIDAKTTDRTEEEIEQYFEDQEGFYLPLTIYHTPPATDVGFDVARNDVIGQAKSDWILWLDSDEYLFNGQAIAKYLKHNMLNGYSIAQHHLSVDPPAIIKVDFPVRIFRNNIGIQFYGCVHEHPEKEINKGVEHAMIIPDVRIMHHGYVHEDIRRGRFDRNIDLLARDREEYPERYLGMFLWIRDLAQMTNYEMEINGPAITDDMRARAKEGISLWRKLLEADQRRMCIDALPYYSILSKLQGKNVSMGFTVDAVKGQPLNLDKARKIEGTFADTEDFSKLFNSMVNQRTANYDSKYF